MISGQPVTQPAAGIRRFFQDEARGRGKRDRTRAAIMDSVVDTVFEWGLAGATVRAIAESAGVSNATVYNHFAGREGAIRETAIAVAKRVADLIDDSYARPAQIDVAVALGTFVFMGHAIDRPPWGRLLVLSAGEMEDVYQLSSKPLTELLRQGYRDGVFRVKISPLLNQQLAALQSLAISEGIRAGDRRVLLRETCCAVLRLLGRSPTEAEGAVSIALEVARAP